MSLFDALIPPPTSEKALSSLPQETKMSEDQQVGVIELGTKEISPEEDAAYREQIRAAKAGNPLSALKTSTPVGGVKKPPMPVLKASRETLSIPDTQQGVQPRPPGSPVLRPETEEKLAEAIKAGQELQQQTGEKQVLNEKKIEDEARLEQLYESFDFGDVQRQINRILDNKRRREDIEKRCAPMAFEDLLMKDEVQQTVPIIPGKFEPTFRSLRPLESLYLKSRMAKETINTEQYLGEKYQLLLLTCSLLSINGVSFPDHRKHHDGSFEVTDEFFDAKFKMVTQKSAYILADLSVNLMWFDIRVRKLINPDDLKNG
jgi:hypothetical protein